MRVSEIFAMGGGPGYGGRDGKGYSGNPEGRFRFSYAYYANYPKGGYSGHESGFNGGFRNASFSRGRGLVGVLG